MESTPKGEKVQNKSSSFNVSAMFESTPKTEAEGTPHLPKINPKKRKVQYDRSRIINDPLSTPQASSTLNESLFKKFESIEIEENCDTPAAKYFKTNECEKLVTPPSTPESHRRYFNETPIKTGSFQKCSSACSVGTPLKEQHDILYPTLKPLEPARRILTPQKFREKIELRHSTPDFSTNKNKKSLLSTVLCNRVIMDNVLQYLSGGDLFRLSMVSQGFRDAVNNSFSAKIRFESFKITHKQNKENYKITPPSSPEVQNDILFREGSLSPRSRNYSEFFETANNLTQNQSLVRCPKCQKPSVVEKSIAQCQNKLSCGYIFCQKCESYSYSPEQFYDQCQDLRLDSSLVVENRRHLLGDVTNSSFDISSVLCSMSSSGYYSGYETSHTPLSVKRNLNMSSFGSGRSSLKKHPKPEKPLFETNRSLAVESPDQSKEEKRKSTDVIAVVKSKSIRKKIENVEPSSPPRVKTYAACSKESRRNLKRLTR
ncbi:uncharacterized protein LOC126747067 [Anthonomus grandis grandis]|uniref:uncharacterized protein LOC126747067 n=1 Tax=Anthonomus grandis grandis TaxID=2921223 RepID=UPI002164FCAA|nr:uncharacterized protein LOC126747067 [Anthonomus grandis grandis]XP_050311526.1 uncharacterized protein LOC126747067 [Anthonomus grandis grandis]